MTMDIIEKMLWLLFAVSVFGYGCTVLKEKYYLKNNIVFIDSKAMIQDYVDEIETRHFLLKDIEIMAGDEIKFYLNNKSVLRGIVLGAKIAENTIVMITAKDHIKFIAAKEIKRCKIISKYGRIFKRF